MRIWSYLPALVVPAAVLASLLAPGWWTFTALVVLFVLLPGLELFLQGSTANLSKLEERAVWRQRRYDVLLYAMVPIQFALLGLYLWRASTGEMTPVEWVGTTLAMGFACGALGINVAHELGHRRKTHEQRMSQALLSTSLYMHFFIEHNRGHHARVATEEDPASARYGETLWGFIPRSMVGGWLHAWALEGDRLRARGRRVVSWSNQMLRFQVIQLALVAAVFVAFGPWAGLGFVVAAVLGGMTLETVNYLEHYGLQRRRRDDGGYERTLPIHSWNSNHPIGRAVLFDLTRHSDHHANARRPYQVLRHFEESPQLPTGYPGMMVLAWMPPLWFAVMHRHIARYQQARAPEAPQAPAPSLATAA